MKNRRAFTAPQLLIGVVAFIIFLIIVVVLAAASEKDTGDAGTGECTSLATHDVTRFTTYGGDCELGCTGWLGSDYAFTKNSAGANARSVNVKKGHPEYAPTNPNMKGIFREVSQDPLLKPSNTNPVLIEYDDPDFGWVKIVARTTATKIFQQQGTIVNVIPTTGPQFKAIVADRGMTPGDQCLDPSTCASLDLLKTSDLAGGFIDDLNLKGKIEILRYGPDGDINCSEGGGNEGDSNATSGLCYRGSQVLDYSFNAWELKASERECLSNAKINLTEKKTPSAIVAAARWLLTRPKVPYSRGCREGGSGGWNGDWGTSCNKCDNGRCFPFTGLDCSSFVSWAHKTAGYKDINDMSTSTLTNSSLFTTITNKQPQAGDILVTFGKGHTILIVKVHSPTNVDTIETGTWHNASTDSGRAVHIIKNRKITYSGRGLIIKGSSNLYKLRRVKPQ